MASDSMIGVGGEAIGTSASRQRALAVRQEAHRGFLSPAGLWRWVPTERSCRVFSLLGPTQTTNKRAAVTPPLSLSQKMRPLDSREELWDVS